MKLSGVHLLVTYRCDLECDHCFVFGSPGQSGTMTLDQIRQMLGQAKKLGTVEWIYFEGGEPFLFYPVMLRGVEEAARLGFKVGIVSDCYWATTVEDSLEWLKPFSGLIHDLALSGDWYHGNEEPKPEVKNACMAAEKLGIPVGVISIARPERGAASVVGQLPPGKSRVMYRGRAAEKLVCSAVLRPWTEFTECPYEDLRSPKRVHIDPFGNLHICQGIVLGNVFEQSLSEVCAAYNADTHPIIGPLLKGGPAELVRLNGLGHEEKHADACHLCYEARRILRSRFPEILKPDQMYGVTEQQ